MKLKDLFSGVVTGKPLKLRGMYNPKDAETTLSTNVSKQTVTVKNNSTGEIIGKRTVYQK